MQDRLIARGDVQLSTQIMADPYVRETIAAIERQGPPAKARRQLLATSLRLARRVAPDVHRVIEESAAKVGLSQAEFELFVYPAAQFNAAAVKPEGGRLFIMISSALLEAFTNAELAFVLGHELGHHLFDHHRVPVGALTHPEARTPKPLLLTLFAWQRYAEISCDRAGVMCAGGMEPAARGLFKLASGIGSDRITIDIDAFMSQLSDLQAETRAARAEAEGATLTRADWFSSHPFSPIRVRAAQLFDESEVMRPAGMSVERLEAETAELLSVMEPSYLEGRTDADEALRRLLFAAGMAVASAESPPRRGSAELESLRQLLGPGAVPDAPSVEAIVAQLPRRVAQVAERVPPLRRFQVIRDLCVIANADGHISPMERRVIDDTAASLGVDLAVVDDHLERAAR